MEKTERITENHVCRYTLLRQNKQDELIKMELKAGSLLIVQVEECQQGENHYEILAGQLMDIDEKKILHAKDVMTYHHILEPVILRCLTDVVLNWHIEGHVFDALNFENDVIINTLDQIMQKDNYTKEHALRVAELSKSLAIAAGCKGREVSNIAVAALAHDLGKVRISDEILNKPSRLTADEYEQIKEHVSLGYEIVKELLPEPITEIILQHHERIDGSGYPNGLKGDAICKGAKILAIADSFDAMHTERPYKLGMDIPAIITELRRCSNTSYEAELVELFIELVR